MFIMCDIQTLKYNNICNTRKLKEKAKYLSVVYMLILLYFRLTSLSLIYKFEKVFSFMLEKL